MKKILLWILTATCLLSACQGEDRNSGDNTSLETFSVQLNPQNTLRADVEVNMKTATTYHIEYWEKDVPKTIQKTLPVVGNGFVKRTLVLLKPHTQYACRLVCADGKRSAVRTFTTQAAPDDIAHATLLTDDMPRELPGYLLVYMLYLFAQCQGSSCVVRIY